MRHPAIEDMAFLLILHLVQDIHFKETNHIRIYTTRQSESVFKSQVASDTVFNQTPIDASSLREVSESRFYLELLNCNSQQSARPHPLQLISASSEFLPAGFKNLN